MNSNSDNFDYRNSTKPVRYATLPPRPASGWVASVAKLSALLLARSAKNRVKPQAVQQLEKARSHRPGHLGALRRVAEAMGCELCTHCSEIGTFAELAERPVRDRAARTSRA